jgi:hypothetical protein
MEKILIRDTLLCTIHRARSNYGPVVRILFPICRRGSRNKGGFHYGKNEGKMKVPNHHGQFKFAPEEFAQLSRHHEG